LTGYCQRSERSVKEPKKPSQRRRPSAGDAAAPSGAAAQPPDGNPGDHAAADAARGAEPAAPGGATVFPVVGIGASAGGIAALEAFFSALPRNEQTGMAFVVVQHLSPDHKSVLVELIGRCTGMQVREAEDGMAVRPECTYIIPPNHDMTLVGGALRLVRHDDQRKPRLTVDHFFTSLAAAQREGAIVIVMSGAGSDGALGIREVKGEGGLVIAQTPESAEYDGMPRSAIATGLVDFVLPPRDMPAQLLTYVRHPFSPVRQATPPPVRNTLLKKVCMLLRAQTGHDFSQYKETTLLRRIERRMAMRQIQEPDDYLRHCRENASELDALFNDLLIGVTSFFRDPDAFRLLQDKVVPRLLADKAAHDPVRVWVCGCSTGEEAYSIAIVLYEQMMASKHVLKLQVFATDIDRHAIEQARAGVYPASVAANVSEERLSRFFVHDAQRGTYRIQQHIRDLLVFSEQDAIKDPPFSRLDLVSCRNLLIYLNADLQRKLIPLFHYALVPGGVLFLGTSETVGESGPLFSVIDRKWKLYTRVPGERSGARPHFPEFVPPLTDLADHGTAPESLADAHAIEAGNLRQITERALLAHYAQAAVLVDSRGQVQYIVGRTGKFLEPSAGNATMNVVAMARDGLRRELTIALHRAVANKQLVTYSGLSVRSNGHTIRTNLSVRPVDADRGSVLYLVVLEEMPPSPQQEGASGGARSDERVSEMERDLRAKEEHLQTTLEEMETTNEELKSTNEEMQSVNEELQSANEELETSKEELQSVNEELSTVNAELQDKVADLSRANNDMNNLLAGTGVATVFVDHQLRIARFTPAATHVINFIESDIGRPLEHVVSNFVVYDGMIDDVRAVLDTLVPKEAEVQVKSGVWYLMRIRPYRTMENLIEGAVITLVDISERKKAEESLRRSEERLNKLINQAYAAVSEVDLDGRLLFANDRLCEMLGYTRDELLRRRLADITDPEDLPRVRTQLEAAMADGADIRVDKRYVRADGKRVRTHERVSALRDALGKPASLLLVSFDFTDDRPGSAR
jgi:two-component system CheB/CheR fusion protein